MCRVGQLASNRRLRACPPFLNFNNNCSPIRMNMRHTELEMGGSGTPNGARGVILTGCGCMSLIEDKAKQVQKSVRPNGKFHCVSLHLSLDYSFTCDAMQPSRVFAGASILTWLQPQCRGRIQWIGGWGDNLNSIRKKQKHVVSFAKFSKSVQCFDTYIQSSAAELYIHPNTIN